MYISTVLVLSFVVYEVCKSRIRYKCNFEKNLFEAIVRCTYVKLSQCTKNGKNSENCCLKCKNVHGILEHCILFKNFFKHKGSNARNKCSLDNNKCVKVMGRVIPETRITDICEYPEIRNSDFGYSGTRNQSEK